jgi:hypothetical protein
MKFEKCVFFLVFTILVNSNFCFARPINATESLELSEPIAGGLEPASCKNQVKYYPQKGSSSPFTQNLYIPFDKVVGTDEQACDSMNSEFINRLNKHINDKIVSAGLINCVDCMNSGTRKKCVKTSETTEVFISGSDKPVELGKEIKGDFCGKKNPQPSQDKLTCLCNTSFSIVRTCKYQSESGQCIDKQEAQESISVAAY